MSRTSMRVNNNNNINVTSTSLLDNPACNMMNYDIVHSSVARRQNVTQIDTTANQHAIANAVLSAEFTGSTLKLFRVMRPTVTMSVHVSFERWRRSSSVRVEVVAVSVFVDADDHPMFSWFCSWVRVGDEQRGFRRQVVATEDTVKVPHVTTYGSVYLFRVHHEKS